MMKNNTHCDLCRFHQEKPSSIDRKEFTDQEDWIQNGNTINCCRVSWRDEENCIWHSSSGKSVDDLETARREGPERLLGAYLSKVEIKNQISFEKCWLTEANLSEADLTGANLSEADLTGANLSEANLTGANLSEANLTGANLSEANLTGANLSGATLSGANLTNSNLSESNLTGTNLWDANLRAADLSESNLTKAILRNSNLSDVNLLLSDLSEANLRGAKLQNATLRSADLIKTNLRDADLLEAELPHANLTEADLRDANLSNATLWGTTLSQSSISRGTHIDRISDPEDASSAEEWDRVARARHELKVAYSTNGLVSQARKYRVREQQAHSRVAKANGGIEGYISWLGSLISRIVTGYGVQLRWIGLIMILVYFGSTVVYWHVGIEDSFYYSIVTFTTSPPEPSPPPGGAGTKLVSMFETFVGTLLIVLLGYVLGNREQI